MAGDNLKYMHASDPLAISAKAWNAFIDTTRLVQRHGPPHPTPRPERFQAPSSTVILVRNATGGDLDQYAVTTLGDVLIAPADNPDGFQQNLAIKVVAPGDPAAKPIVAILQDPLADGAFGLATILGMTWVKVDVSTDETGWQWANVVSGQTSKLDAAESSGPARIVWKESGLGEKWAIVVLGAPSGAAGGSVEAEEVEVVTSVECSGGSIVTTTASINSVVE